MLLHLPPSTTWFQLAFSLTWRTAKQQNHLDSIPKEAGIQPETCKARLKGAKLFATYCFPCCPVALVWQAQAGRAAARPCSAARWFAHQDTAEPKARSPLAMSWGCFSITMPSHGSWTALAKAQLLHKQKLTIYSCIKPGTIGPSPNASIYTLT